VEKVCRYLVLETIPHCVQTKFRSKNHVAEITRNNTTDELSKNSCIKIVQGTYSFNKKIAITIPGMPIIDTV